MSNRTYHMIELVGSSDKSIENAIENAVAEASKKHSHLDWFEVIETRGYIRDGSVKFYQVTIKVGYYESA